MKKFLALLLSVMMLLTLTAAFAEEAVAPSTTEASFTKKYENAIPVGDTLTFNTEFVVNQTTGSTVAPETAILPATITLNVTEDEDGVFDVPFTVTAPAEYGTYIYKITEDTTNANPSVSYDDEALFIGVLYTADKLTVTLINDPNAAATTDLVVEDRTVDTDNDTKKDQFVNQYNVGSFEVTKVITGNAANMSDRFVVEVTFTSEKNLDNLAMVWLLKVADGETPVENPISTITALKAGEPATMTIEIGHNETIFFDMVPVGVQVSVTETNQVGKADLNYYQATYQGNDITIPEDGSSQTITITNTKETSIPTGIELDSIPYIVMLAVAVLGAVGFIVKRRLAAAADEN